MLDILRKLDELPSIQENKLKKRHENMLLMEAPRNSVDDQGGAQRGGGCRNISDQLRRSTAPVISIERARGTRPPGRARAGTIFRAKTQKAFAVHSVFHGPLASAEYLLVLMGLLRSRNLEETFKKEETYGTRLHSLQDL